MKTLKIESILDGLKTGFIMSIPFFLFYNIMENLFTSRPYPLSWIDGGYGIILLSVSGLILGAWRKFDDNRSVDQA